MKNRIYQGFLILSMFIMASLGVAAQNALFDHEITESDGVYTSIRDNGGIVLHTGNSDDSSYRLDFPDGFTFNFDNEDINHCYVHDNGWISLNYNTGGTYSGHYLARWRMMIGYCQRDMYTRGAMYYKLEGATGDRVLTIEYYNTSFYSNYPPYFNVQFKFYEKNNMIQIIFGPIASASWASQVGWFSFIGHDTENAWYNIQPGAPSTIHMAPDGETAAFFGKLGAVNCEPYIYDGKTYTYGGTSEPELNAIVPVDLSSWEMGYIYTQEEKLPAAYVTREAGMPAINLEMDILRKDDPTRVIYHAVRNNIEPVSPDEDTPVKVYFNSAVGDAAGTNGCIDLFTNRTLIEPGDYVAKVVMTHHGDPEFRAEMQSDIILPVSDDMAVQKIIAPLDMDRKIYPITGVPVEVMVRNTGINPRAEWKLEIVALDDDGNEVYTNEFNYPDDDPRYPDVPDLTTNETYNVDFGMFFPDNVGDFYFTARVSFTDADDQLASNNAIPSSASEEYHVNVAYEYDIRVARMLNPENEEEKIVMRPFKPECCFYNHGVNDGTENTVMMYFTFGGDTVYADTLENVAIVEHDTTRVKMDKDFAPPYIGQYQSHFKIVSEDDTKPDYKEKSEMFSVVPALQGIYTIGLENEPGEGEDPNPRNFPDIQTAVNALYERGVTGDVEFHFTDRVYTVGSLELTKNPAVDLSSRITGVDAEHTVTFKASPERAVERGGENSGVTINLLAGNGIGFLFGQNPYPLNPNAVAYYSANPMERLSDASLPYYVNSEGYFNFDGGRNKSLRFLITTPSVEDNQKYFAAPMYLGPGSKNITVQNCVFDNAMSVNEPAHSRIPHTKRNISKREFQPDRDETEGTGYSAAVVLRSKTPIFEDDQNRLLFDTLSCDNNVIKNNIIRGFGYGIASMGAGPILQEHSGQYHPFYNTNNLYEGNEIYNVSHAGIFLGYEHASTIKSNRIYNVLGNSPSIDVIAEAGFAENLALAAGILIGDAGDPYDNSWNSYNSTEINITGNEISGVAYSGTKDNAGAAGIVIVQGQNEVITPGSGYDYFPKTAEQFTISNNIIWGVTINNPQNERTGVKMAVIPSSEIVDYKTRQDVIINNTIVLDDDNMVTSGSLSGISLKGSREAKILNNAIAITDENIFWNPAGTDINALVYYEGIMPGQPGGLISNRNAFWKPEKTDDNDKSGVAVYGFKEYYTKTGEWLPYHQDDYESLRQWRNWTEQDYNSIMADFTEDYTFVGSGADRCMRIVEPYPTGSVLNNRAFNYSEYLISDIDGKTRGEAGALYDIGACEFNGSLYLQDMEIKTISEPSTYQSGHGMFNDAEYMMTAFPLDCKVVVRNSGSLDQAGVEITLRIYRENTDGVFPEDPVAEVTASADVVTSQSAEVSFNLPEVEAERPDSEKIFRTYSDFRDDDIQYNIPEHFRGFMESNVTPRYKFEIEIRPDEKNANNYASTIARFYIKRSNELNMIVTGVHTDADIYHMSVDPGDDVEAGKLNFDKLAGGFSKLAWRTDIDKDVLFDDEEVTDTLKIDVFNRNSWEPKSVDYTNYKLVYWSEGNGATYPEKQLSRYERWDIEDYLAAGVMGNKKNLIMAGEEIVAANSFKFVGLEAIEDQDFVNNVLRCAYNDPMQPWAAGGSGKSVVGVTVDRDQVRAIEHTRMNIYDYDNNGNSDDQLSDDPMPICGLMNPYTEGAGLTRVAYYYRNDGTRTEEDSTMGISTVVMDRNILVLGVDWRHFADIESIVRATVDFTKENDGWSVPVELTAFDAKLIGDKVQLNWTTRSEINSDKFEIERAELNNGLRSDFANIASVPAAGKSVETIHYGPYSDADVSFGNTYIYRLGMVDADGTVVYSDEKLVEITGELSIGKVYPSPAENEVTFEVRVDDNSVVMVYDANGKLMVADYDKVGNNTIKLRLDNYASGVYTLVVKNDNATAIKKFTVAK